MFNQHHKFLASIDQPTWETMLANARLKCLAAPLDAHIHGTIESALETFMMSRKESPEAGDLKSFPGFDEQQEFFSLGALKTFLKNGNIRYTDRDVCNRLRKIGYEPGPKRLGQDVARVWARTLNVNGEVEAPAVPDMFGTPEKPEAPDAPGSNS